MVIIRPAAPADASAIARFIVMAERGMIPFLTGFDDPRLAEEKLSSWVVSPVPNRYSLANSLVAEAGGRPVAAAVSFPADAQPDLDVLILGDVRRRGRDLDSLFFEGVPGTYYLSTMGVDPAFRRRGIGTALMLASEERARGLGFSRTSLLVDKSRPRAKALYERLGHTVAEEVALGPAEYFRMVRGL